VLYGVRYDHPQNRRRGVRPLEAQFVQAVADTVAARQAALAQETQLAQMRVRLEQAFSPTVARELERNPKLLEGDEREITVLFADLRGSTTLAESLAPRALYQLLGDVLERLTQVVTSFEGTVIDYYGDGLAAFWNAPLPRAGHPLLACQAAHAMQRELHDLSHDWQPLLGRRLHLGIGIHTGLALVGNAGSQRRIKYGPRGSTVHLAARIEGATRHVGVPILLSSATAHAVAGALPTRRVFRDILSGIAEPVDLFEPLYPSEGLPAPDALLSRALEQYEQGDDAAALTTLTALREAHPSDAAVAHLLRRTQSRSASRSS
jgi:adenylate cyclase